MATQREVAEHLDLTDRNVRYLLQSGVIPASKGRGGYNLDDCRMAYIRYIRGQAKGQVRNEEAEDGELLNQKREKEDYLLTRERRIGQQQKNELNSRLVVPVEFAIYSLSKLSAQLATIFDTLPLAMKRKHPDLEARHIDTLTRELAKARNAASSLGESIPGQLDEYHDKIRS